MTQKTISHITIDHTTISTFRTCGRRFDYSLHRGFQPDTDSDALAFGSVIHEALAAYHSSNDESTALEKFREAASKTHLPSLEPNAMRSVAHGEILLAEYFTQYGNDAHAAFSPLLVEGIPSLELRLETQVNDRITYSGLCDGVVVDKATGEVKGLEHKTSYVLGSQFGNRMNPNDQLTGYLYLLQENGHDTNTVIANGLQTARRKIETKPRDCFSRHETRRTPWEIDEWRERLIDDTERLVRDIERNFFHANMPDACSMWNSTCPYRDVCLAESDDRSRMLTASYRHDPWRMFKIKWKE